MMSRLYFPVMQTSKTNENTKNLEEIQVHLRVTISPLAKIESKLMLFRWAKILENLFFWPKIETFE